MTTTWFQWRLQVGHEQSDLAAQLLLENGCDGVQIEDMAVLFDESEDATIAPTPTVTVTGYTQNSDQNELRRKLEAALQMAAIPAQLEVEAIADDDWANNWRENFPPLHIGPFLIAPSWEPPTSTDAIVIELDPGLAFGTGQHPTTHLCLEMLPECLKRTGKPTPRVLDVGCGSGILSIAAAKLGAQVIASDLDPHCTRATHENAELNGVNIQIVQAAGLDWLKPEYSQFDLVVANLMSDLLIRLAPELRAATAPDGVLLVSGISAPRADEVEKAFHATGLSTLQSRMLDGDQRGDWVERWAAFVFAP